MNNTSLSTLLTMIKSADAQDEAFAELVRRYSPLIHKKVSAFFSSGADISEAIQEAQIALHSAALSYDGERCEGVTFGLYAGICIANRLRTLLRSRKRDSENTELVESDKLSSAPDVEGFLASRESCERVMKIARAILSDFEYSVFRLQLEGYATREIAKRLSRESKSVDNAKTRISHRLRKNADICRVFADII